MTFRRVQKSLLHQFSTILSWTESGRAGAIQVASAQLTVGVVVTDLLEADLAYTVAEAAYPTASGHSTQLTAAPVYGAGAGPGGENIWTLTVIDSSGFIVGDFIKTFDKMFPGGSTFEILSLPSGTSVVVHGASDEMDIVDGDTIVEADGTGEYVVAMSFDVNDYFTTSSPVGSLVLVLSSVIVADDPAFTASSTAVRDFNFELDLTGQSFRIG